MAAVVLSVVGVALGLKHIIVIKLISYRCIAVTVTVASIPLNSCTHCKMERFSYKGVCSACGYMHIKILKQELGQATDT